MANKLTLYLKSNQKLIAYPSSLLNIENSIKYAGDDDVCAPEEALSNFKICTPKEILTNFKKQQKGA